MRNQLSLTQKDLYNRTKIKLKNRPIGRYRLVGHSDQFKVVGSPEGNILKIKKIFDNSFKTALNTFTAKWEEIIYKFEKNRFLPWVWPEKKNLEFIGKCVRSQNLKSLISVGCGSGLFEWLLASATGLEVMGIEIDRNWWKSKYSSGTFIPMVLTEDPQKGELKMETKDSALLFCYFNNLKAFLNYVDNFKGSCLIGVIFLCYDKSKRCDDSACWKYILLLDSKKFEKSYNKHSKTTCNYKIYPVIGPGRGRGTYTIPEPFSLPGGLEKSWKLSDHQEIRTSKDFIAVYARK